MTQTLAIVHTSKSTIDMLQSLATELLPTVKIHHMLDDSILPQLANNNGDLETVAQRWMAYAQIAAEQGADVILSACSSVGELAERARDILAVPVLRIDEAMAEAAVRGAKRIGVLATLQSTLRPTEQLIRRKANICESSIEVQTQVIPQAYELLLSGDGQGHDKSVVNAILAMADQTDIVLLAQASMARVMPLLAVDIQAKLTTSPRLGMLQVRKMMLGTD